VIEALAGRTGEYLPAILLMVRVAILLGNHETSSHPLAERHGGGEVLVAADREVEKPGWAEPPQPAERRTGGTGGSPGFLATAHFVFGGLFASSGLRCSAWLLQAESR